MLALVEYLSYSGADFSREIPRVVALDHAFKLTQVEWILSSEKIVLPPWLSPTGKEIMSAFEPPASLVGPVIFSKYSGVLTHNALVFFQSLVFIFLVLLVFAVIGYIFRDNWVAFISAVFIAFPIENFFLADLAGITRATFAMLFSITVVFGLYLLWRGEKNSGIFLGVFMLGLFLGRPVDILSILPFGFFLPAGFFKATDRKYFFTQVLLAVLISSMGLLYVIPAIQLFSQTHFSSIEFVSLEEFEKNARGVGPIIMLKEYSFLLVLFSISILALLFFSLEGKISWRSLLFDDRSVFIFSGIFLAFVTLGVFEWNVVSQSKWRHLLYGFFLAPAIFFSLSVFFKRISLNKGPDHAKKLRPVIGSASVFVLILFGFANFSEASYLTHSKINEKNYEILQFIRANTPPDATVLSIDDLVQNSVILTYRPSAYFVLKKYVENSFVPVCVDGFKIENFFFKTVNCENQPKKMTDFDYLIIHAPSEEVEQFVVMLQENGFAKVFEIKNDPLYKDPVYPGKSTRYVLKNNPARQSN